MINVNIKGLLILMKRRKEKKILKDCAEFSTVNLIFGLIMLMIITLKMIATMKMRKK